MNLKKLEEGAKKRQLKELEIIEKYVASDLDNRVLAEFMSGHPRALSREMDKKISNGLIDKFKRNVELTTSQKNTKKGKLAAILVEACNRERASQGKKDGNHHASGGVHYGVANLFSQSPGWATYQHKKYKDDAEKIVTVLQLYELGPKESPIKIHLLDLPKVRQLWEWVEPAKQYVNNQKEEITGKKHRKQKRLSL